MRQIAKELHETHYNYPFVAQQITSGFSKTPVAIPHPRSLLVLERENSAKWDCHQLLYPDLEMNNCWKLGKNWERVQDWQGEPLGLLCRGTVTDLTSWLDKGQRGWPDGSEHFMPLRPKELVWGLGGKSLTQAFTDIYPHN